MRKKTCNLGTAALIVAAFGIAPAYAATLITYPKTDYPASSEVITVPAGDAGFGDDANVSLTQTFKVDSSFTARRIYLAYRNDPNGGTGEWSMNVRLFAVADVFATDLTDPGTGSDLFSGTFSFTNMGDTELIAQIDLTSGVLLDASVGNSGYALHITESSNADFNPGWEWLRPTSEAYADGNMYEDGVEKNGGERDLSLAISSVPEPSGALLSLLGATLLLKRRRN
ncbi:PEP-CTERM sorting domain-containing protein [Haloferula chungangensis]|uniref:PEP-CTERM sorting domain-containing protein n=1 Tax=Haloferula chungangensis TaxID=1048331 RepID=A0ABW2L8F3_9BACT